MSGIFITTEELEATRGLSDLSVQDTAYSDLAIALGYRVAQAGLKTRFAAADLLLTLSVAHAQNQLKTVMQRAIAGYRQGHRTRTTYPASIRDLANAAETLLRSRGYAYVL